jgi:hypothetical protein
MMLVNGKPFAWSFSALSRYTNCPRQYYHLNIAHDFKEIEGDANKWGLRVHDAMADRILHAKPLPEGMQQWEKWADYVLDDVDRTQMILRAEQKMAVTFDMQPCEFFDRTRPPWLRVVLDVLKIKGDFAHVIDWKTGQNMEVDSNQLAISAAVVFAHYPAVQAIQCEYVWLAHDARKNDRIERADLRNKWAMIAPQVARIYTSIRDRSWPPQKSGLCKRYCPVTTCEFHGKGNR